MTYKSHGLCKNGSQGVDKFFESLNAQNCCQIPEPTDLSECVGQIIRQSWIFNMSLFSIQIWKIDASMWSSSISNPGEYRKQMLNLLPITPYNYAFKILLTCSATFFWAPTIYQICADATDAKMHKARTMLMVIDLQISTMQCDKGHNTRKMEVLWE